MYVFIDESGDTGFKVEKGSSQIFCLAAVLFRSVQAIEETQAVMDQIREELRLKKSHEFHFNKESDRYRTAFCKAICRCPFTVRAIVIDKDVIYEGTLLRKSPKHFYNFTTRMLLEKSFGSIRNAKVRIDGSMNRDLRTYLRRELKGREKIIRDVKFSHSSGDSMIQLADMMTGSIARSYRSERKESDAYRRILHPCIEDVWEFGTKK